MNKYHCIVGEHETTEPQAAKIEDSACCLPCAEANNHPGKFEKYSDNCGDGEPYLGDMGKALILYHWMLDSGEDNFMSNQGWGYCGQFGKYLLTEDTNGFVEFEEFDDAAAAQKKFDALYDDGWGASEDDIYVTHYNGKWKAWVCGKEIHVYENHAGEVTRSRVLAAISLHMRKTGYFPSIWEEHERGGLTNIGAEVW